jgi:di/tricarboxylate transporter
MSGGHLAEGDLLVLRGEAQAAADFASRNALSFREADAADTLMNRQAGLAEVIIPPRSSFIGRDAFPGMVTSAGDLVVLAIQRGGEDMGPGSVTIAAGDHILLQGTWNALDSRLATPGVLLVESPELVRRQAVPLGAGAKSMLIVVGLMVAAIASGLATATVAGLMAAGAAILMNAISVERAYRAVNWTTIILIAAMFPISTAMYQTGGAAMIGEALVRLVGDSGPRVLLAALFVLAAGLGTVISNTATAMIVIPVAVIAAAQSGVSAQPVLMALNIGASAAFLTPVSTAVNLMVMGPAGYQFGDYWKLGLPLTLWYFVTAVFLVPLIWAF